MAMYSENGPIKNSAAFPPAFQGRFVRGVRSHFGNVCGSRVFRSPSRFCLKTGLQGALVSGPARGGPLRGQLPGIGPKVDPRESRSGSPGAGLGIGPKARHPEPAPGSA